MPGSKIVAKILAGNSNEPVVADFDSLLHISVADDPGFAEWRQTVAAD
jgi:hypothetical protein